MAEENRRTVAVGFGANLLIAAAKLIGGLLSGSVAMLAEAAHSLADTVNQVFLFVSLTFLVWLLIGGHLVEGRRSR